MKTDPYLIALLLILLAIIWISQLLQVARARIHAKTALKPKTLRQLKPKTGDDCPLCRAEKDKRDDPQPKQSPKPWREVKSQRGRKKTLSTQGYSCPNQDCIYFGIADERIHALVGYGRHGKAEVIQDLRCQSCGRKISARWGTALYRLKTSSTRVALILALMAEGVDVSALERVFGNRERTLRTWLTRAGLQAGKVHRHFFQHLILHPIQLDELWVNVRQGSQEVWVWAACDAKTKLIPVLQLGPRTQDMAYSVVHELKARLTPGCVPVFSSDGLKHYFYALTAHFGEWFQCEDQPKPTWLMLASFAYAQVVKHQRRFRLVDVEHRMIWGLPSEYLSRLKAAGLSGNINTSFVERANLTICQCVSKLTRRTWGSAQFTPELCEQVFWWLAYYHFCRYHESLRIKLGQPVKRKGKQRPKQYRKVTPAIAAGLTNRRWSVMQLISYPLP